MIREFRVARAGRIELDAAGVEHAVPPGDGQDPREGQRPSGGDHVERPFLRPPPQVLERRGDGPVAVEAQHEQVEDAGRACAIVDREPRVAHPDAEHPSICVPMKFGRRRRFIVHGFGISTF